MTEGLIQKGENWLKTALFFIPRVIANVFDALTMNDNGYSWKKIVSGYAIYGAMEFSKQHISSVNALEFTFMWIAFAGILIGAYSLPDIMNAFSKLKEK